MTPRTERAEQITADLAQALAAPESAARPPAAVKNGKTPRAARRQPERLRAAAIQHARTAQLSRSPQQLK
jgi:hypothetical protein